MIEPNLIYPLIRGRDIKRWKAAPLTYILLTQNPTTRKGWPESEMKTKWPCTYSFLKQFEHELRNRSGYKKYFDPKSDAFWSIYNVGSYTLAPYKVMWRQMLKTINAAVMKLL